jgi:ABC-type nitrate/sulfonate/bicarbonate transport system substrate-binding protein
MSATTLFVLDPPPTQSSIDFAWIFEGWTSIEVKLKGMELYYISARELDPALDYYTPLLITNRTAIQKHPEEISKFLKATEKGYQYAIAHREESADILLKGGCM